MSSIISFILDKYFRWTAGVVVILVLVFGYVFVIHGRIEAVRTTGFLERQKVEDAIKADQAYLQKLKTSVDTYHATLTQNDINTINNFIPTQADFPGLLMNLKLVAEDAGLTLQDMSVSQVGSGATGAAATTTAPAPTIAGTALQTQDVAMTVTGGMNYDTFKKFILKVESSQRLMDVVSVSFGGNAKTQNTTTTGDTYTLTVRTYYLAAKLK